MAFMAMADGSTNMAIMDIQSKGIEKLTQLCCFQRKTIFLVQINIV